MVKKTSLVFCMAALVMLFAAAGAYAQFPASCPPNAPELSSSDVPPGGTGLNTKTIAVASNFFGPSQTMITNYLGTVTSTTVTICEGATGDIVTYINNNPGVIDAFFAADGAAAQFNSTLIDCEDPLEFTPSRCAFAYAQGIPVFFGWVPGSGKTNTIADISILLTQSGNPGFGSGVYFDSISDNSLSGFSFNTAANDVAIANPATAPYGDAAVNILSFIDAGNTAIWDIQPNVTQTFNAVGGGSDYSGFVAKSQVCSMLDTHQQAPLADTIAYVEFPDSGPTQQTIQLTSNGASIINYVYSNVGTRGWNNFLVSNCYKTP